MTRHLRQSGRLSAKNCSLSYPMKQVINFITTTPMALLMVVVVAIDAMPHW